MSTIRSEKTRKSFADYLAKHPQERFWQALRNWSGLAYIWAEGASDADDFFDNGQRRVDTFHWEGRIQDDESAPPVAPSHAVPMTCRHTGEGTAEADKRLGMARDILAATGWVAVTDASFLTAVVTWLWAEHDAVIDMIATDQWHLVCALVEAGPREGETVRAECDMVEDGLADLVIWFSENDSPAPE